MRIEETAIFGLRLCPGRYSKQMIVKTLIILNYIYIAQMNPDKGGCQVQLPDKIMNVLTIAEPWWLFAYVSCNVLHP